MKSAIALGLTIACAAGVWFLWVYVVIAAWAMLGPLAVIGVAIFVAAVLAVVGQAWAWARNSN